MQSTLFAGKQRIPVRNCSRPAFTLVELFVVIGVIFSLAALLIPAVQAVREVSRRAQCANNMKQIVLAAHNYVGTFNVFPMGTPVYKFPDIGVYAGHSVFVALLPQLERADVYNTWNLNLNIYRFCNQTLHETGIGTFWCPSDNEVTEISMYPRGYQDIPNGRFRIAHSSYAACAGTWYHLSFDLKELNALTRQDNGVAYANSAVHYGDITDGGSQTLFLGERLHSRLDYTKRYGWHWWFDGYHGDTLFWTLYPPNPQRRIPMDLPTGDDANPFVISAGSLHPGGANFAFSDGSVRYIRDSIETWPSNTDDGFPEGVSGDPTQIYVLSPGTRFGVYQSISTRNGGETISTSSLD